MRTRLYAHASAAAAVLLTLGVGYTAVHRGEWLALFSLSTVALFSWNARRCYALARREQVIAQRLERLGSQDTGPCDELPSPCCSFWLHSDGEVHAPGCTRPAAARTTLTPAERTAFAEIARAFHRTGDAA